MTAGGAPMHASAFTDAFEGMIGRDGEVIPAGRGYAIDDMERWVPESRKSQQRTAFQRDRARLTHSSALRRLGAKTQVLVAGTDDFARTRLTHTLEVAQIGRQIATVLGCDPDVVDCACLAHDLGHPPFGHNGEAELARIADPIGGFEGNAQTLRLLTRLEPKVFRADGRSAGLNLTRACLDASVKYPWDLARARERGTRKFCVYPEEREVFAWLRRGAPGERLSVEAQVMDLSDDIAYSVHDVEDAIVIGAFEPASMADPRIVEAVIDETRAWYGQAWDPGLLEDAVGRLRDDGVFAGGFDGSRRSLARLKNLTSDLIGRFAGAVECATRDTHGPGPLTRYGASLVIPEDTAYEIMALKGVAVHFVMAPRAAEPLHERQRRIIADLVDVFMERSPQPHPALAPVFLDDWRRAGDDGARLRVAVDQVASLTDIRAVNLHDTLCG